MSLLKQLASSNYISVNKTLIKTIGLEEAIMIGELCSEYDYWDEHNQLTDDGYFYATIEKIQDNTGLSEYQQRKAIRTLESLDIVRTKLKGLPATRYFMIDEEMLFSFLQTSSEKTKELGSKKLNSSNNQIIKTEKKSLIAKAIKEERPKNEVDNFIALYHEICTSLPKVKSITDKRAKAIKKLLKSYSLDDVKEVFTKAEESDFLTGRNDRGWKADIDFILREDKFINILEGKYDSKRKSVSAESSLKLDRNADKSKLRKEIASGKSEKF